jgi:hypothetical protein
MKIYTNGYKHNWISPYTVKEKFFFWKKDYNAFKKKPPVWLSKACNVWLKVANKLNPEIRYIHIDKYDVWNMDSTLTTIILPMLKKLKELKHGAPFVDDSDVPYGLRSFNAAPEENQHDWDGFVLEELIWTFTALHPDTDYEDNYSWGNIDFMWLEAPDSPECKQLHHSPKHNHRFDSKGLEQYHARIDNGLRLFGKYYRALWD